MSIQIDRMASDAMVSASVTGKQAEHIKLDRSLRFQDSAKCAPQQCVSR